MRATASKRALLYSRSCRRSNYYDSQSGVWVPSLPETFNVGFDASDPSSSSLNDTNTLQTGLADKEAALREMSSSYSSVILPSTPVLSNNNNLLSFSTLFPTLRMFIPSTFPYNASMSFPANIVFTVPYSTDPSFSDKGGILEHIKAHSSKANQTMATLTCWQDQEGFMTASSVGSLLDNDVTFLHLQLEESTDPSKLQETIEEIGYLDAPGVPAKGRMTFSSADWSRIDEECFEIIQETLPGGEIFVSSPADMAVVKERLPNT